MKHILATTAILLCLAGCSPEPAAAPDGVANASTPPAEAPPSPAPLPPAPAEASTDAETLTLEGLGALRIGREVPTGSGWAERGARISDRCHTISSPAYSGVYAIVEEGKVRRITVGPRSAVRLVEGIGPGSTEAKVRAAFAGFRQEPHKYSEAPAKYLTAPNAPSGDPALRFEIGTDGKVGLMHVGTKPALFYVEGCA
jgi:hypothetical protein